MSMLCLARHPPVNAPPGICYGRLDVPLADGWQGFATRLASAMQEAGVARLYTSPLARCRIPALHAGACAGVPVAFDDRLVELDFGDWEGRRWDDIPRTALDRWAADLLDFAPPGGESGRTLCARISAFHAGLMPGEPCAVLSHGGPLRVLQACAEGQAPDLARPAPPLGDILTIRTALRP